MSSKILPLVSETLDLSRINALRGSHRPCYKQHPRQSHPQPACIALTEDGVVKSVVDYDIGGGYPSDVWHGRTLWFQFPADMTASKIRELVRRLLPSLERVHAGHEVEWDGHNHVGRLTDDAAAASNEIAEILGTDAE